MNADGTAGRPASTRKVSESVFVNYLLSNLGYYTLLPVLPLLLVARHSAAWFVGAALFTLAFSARASCLLLTGLLHRAAVRAALCAGLLTAAAGFGGLAVSSGTVQTMACLLIAGAGISVNTLMARSYVAMALPSAAARNTAFSVIQVAVNVAAAAGPIAANLLFSSHRQVICLLLVAGLYTAGALLVAVIVPAGLRPADHDARRPSAALAVAAIAASRQVRVAMMVAVTGWFLYGQLFSALTLHISSVTSQPLLRSAFFTMNAVLVVLVQIPVSGYAFGRLTDPAGPLRFLLLGLAIFGVAFGEMAGLGGLGGAGGMLVTTFAAVAIFSVAETFFTPFVTTTFAQLSGDRPVVEAFSLLQIAMAIGEPLGSFSGGTLYSIASRHGVQPLYWGSLSVIALSCAAVFGYPCAGPPAAPRARGAPAGRAGRVRSGSGSGRRT